VKIEENGVIGNSFTVGADGDIKKNTEIGNGVTIGTDVQIGVNVVIADGRQIGNNVTIETNAIVPAGALIPDGTIIYACSNDPPVIGAGTTFGSNQAIEDCVVIGTNGAFGNDVDIKKHTMIGDNANMGTAHSLVIEVNGEIGDNVEVQGGSQVTIKKNAVIGDNVVIVAGITIEENNTVEAGAIVTSNTPTNALVVNSPPYVAQLIADVVDSEIDPDRNVDLGAAFNDAENVDADLTYSITSNTNSAAVGTSITGTTLTLSYTVNNDGTAIITVRATDEGGKTVEDTFTVIVETSGTPVITLSGANPQVFGVGDAYSELGATADDIEDGNGLAVTDIDISALDLNTEGTYLIDYDFQDSDTKDAVTVQRTVIVYTDVFNSNSGGFSVGSGETYLVTGSSTTISGDVDLNGGTLIIENGATIDGSVLAKSGTNSLTIDSATITGTVKLNDGATSTTATIRGNTIGGSINIGNSLNVIVTGNIVTGSVTDEGTNSGTCEIAANTASSTVFCPLT